MSVDSLAAALAPGRAPPRPEPNAARTTAQAFEALAIGQMLQPMFATVDGSKSLFGGGKGEAVWKSLLVDEMAKMLAQNGGIGLADDVVKELLRLQEKA